MSIIAAAVVVFGSQARGLRRRVPYFPLSKDMSLCLELRFSLPESKVTSC